MRLEYKGSRRPEWHLIVANVGTARIIEFDDDIGHEFGIEVKGRSCRFSAGFLEAQLIALEMLGVM